MDTLACILGAAALTGLIYLFGTTILPVMVLS